MSARALRLLLLSRTECGQSPPALGSSPRVRGKQEVAQVPRVLRELTQDDIAASAFRAITTSCIRNTVDPANDSASLRFAGHDKGERPEACLETAGWMDSLALYKCRAFSPRVESCCYFKPGGGYQPDKVKRNRDRSGKLGLACNQNTADVLPNKKLVAPTSVGATSLNAVAQGFEPWVAVTPHSISSAAPSAARTRYLGTPQ